MKVATLCPSTPLPLCPCGDLHECTQNPLFIEYLCNFRNVEVSRPTAYAT